MRSTTIVKKIEAEINKDNMHLTEEHQIIPTIKIEESGNTAKITVTCNNGTYGELGTINGKFLCGYIIVNRHSCRYEYKARSFIDFARKITL